MDQSHIEVHSDYSFSWPTVLDYRQRSIHPSILSQFLQSLFQHIQTLKYLPNKIKSSLFRTQADLYLTSQQYTQAMHAYIISIAIDTSLFSSNSTSQQDDSMIKNMIKATLQLGKFEIIIEDFISDRIFSSSS